MNNPFEVIEARLSNLENLILDLKYHSSGIGNQSDPDQLMNVKEAATFLNLTPYTLYGMVSRGEVPVNKKAKKLMFLKSELMEWVKSGRKKTSSEIEAEAVNYLKPSKRRSHE